MQNWLCPVSVLFFDVLAWSASLLTHKLQCTRYKIVGRNLSYIVKCDFEQWFPKSGSKAKKCHKNNIRGHMLTVKREKKSSVTWHYFYFISSLSCGTLHTPTSSGFWNPKLRQSTEQQTFCDARLLALICLHLTKFGKHLGEAPAKINTLFCIGQHLKYLPRFKCNHVMQIVYTIVLWCAIFHVLKQEALIC